MNCWPGSLSRSSASVKRPQYDFAQPPHPGRAALRKAGLEDHRCAWRREARSALDEARLRCTGDAADRPQRRLSVGAGRPRYGRRRGAGAVGARPGTGRGRASLTGGRLCRLQDRGRAARDGPAAGEVHRGRCAATRNNCTGGGSRRRCAHGRSTSCTAMVTILPSICRRRGVPTLVTLHLPVDHYPARGTVSLPARAVLQLRLGLAAADLSRTAPQCCRKFPTACRSPQLQARGTRNGNLRWPGPDLPGKGLSPCARRGRSGANAAAHRRPGVPLRGPRALFRRRRSNRGSGPRAFSRQSRFCPQTPLSDRSALPVDAEPHRRDELAGGDGGDRLRHPGRGVSGRRAARHRRAWRDRLSCRATVAKWPRRSCSRQHRPRALPGNRSPAIFRSSA